MTTDSKAMHTPGKWRYVRAGYGSHKADFDIVSGDGGRIASTPYEDKARLIAAAPELLKALETLRARLDACELGPVNGGREIADTLATEVEQARAAIASATEGK